MEWSKGFTIARGSQLGTDNTGKTLAFDNIIWALHLKTPIREYSVPPYFFGNAQLSFRVAPIWWDAREQKIRKMR